jgi:hypothetical protein
VAKFIETQKQNDGCQWLRGLNGEIFNGVMFQFCKDKKVQEINGGDSYATMCTYYSTLHLEMVEFGQILWLIPVILAI